MYNEETEELDDGLKTISGDIADLTKTTSKPMGVTLFTDESHTTYRTTYEILKDIADIWDELEDKQRADLLQKLFGKTRAQAGAAILSNFDQAERALITLQNSAGSADREMAVIEQSWDFKINRLKETWTGFVQELIDRGTFGDLIDDLTNISKLIQDLAKNIGLVGTTIASLGIYGGAHGAGPLDLIQTLRNANKNRIPFLNESQQNTTNQMLGEDFLSLDRATQATRLAQTKDNLLALGDQSSLQYVNMLTKAYKENDGQLRILMTDYSGYKNAQILAGQASAMETLKTQAQTIAHQALNIAISMVAATLVNFAVQAIMAVVNAQDNLIKQTKAYGSTLETNAKELSDYQAELQKLANTITDSSSSFEDIAKARNDVAIIQQEMINKYQDEALVTQAVTDAINGQVDAFDELAKARYEASRYEFNNENQIEKFLRKAGEGLGNLHKIHEFIEGRRTLGFDTERQGTSEDKISSIIRRSKENQLVRVEFGFDDKNDRQLQKLLQFGKISDKLDILELGKGIQYGIDLSGTWEEIYEKLLKIKSLSDSGLIRLDNENLQGLHNTTQEVKEQIDTYKSIRDNETFYNKIYPNEDYKKTYKNLQSLTDTQSKANISGDKNEIKKATADLYNTFTEGMYKAAKEDKDKDVANYYVGMLTDSMKDAMQEFQFDDLFKRNDSVRERIKDSLKNLRGYTNEELKAMVGTGNADFNALIQNGLGYGFRNANQYIDYLTNVGYINTSLQREYSKLFGEDVFNKLTDEERSALNKHKNIYSEFYDVALDYGDGYEKHMLDIAKTIANSITSTDIDNNIDKAKSSVEEFQTTANSLNEIIAEQNSNGKLSAKTFDTLKENLHTLGVAEENLGKYYKFGAGGIELNLKAVRKLMKEKQAKNAKEIAKAYDETVDAYNDAKTALDGYSDVLANSTDLTEDQRQALQSLIASKQEDVNVLARQKDALLSYKLELEGLTDEYTVFQEALSSADDGAHYTSMFSAVDQMKKEAEQGLWGTDQMDAWLAYQTDKLPEEIEKMTRKEKKELFDNSIQKATRYSTEDETGVYNLYKDIIKISETQDDLEDVVTVFEDGTYKIHDMDKAAQKLGMSTSALVDGLMRMRDYGYKVDFNFDKQTIDSLKTERDTLSAMAASGDKSAAEELKKINDQIDKLEAKQNWAEKQEKQQKQVQGSVKEAEEYLSSVGGNVDDEQFQEKLKNLNESIKELGEYTVGENGTLEFNAKISDDSKDAISNFKQEVEDASSDRKMYFDFSQPFAAAQSLVDTVEEASRDRNPKFTFTATGLDEIKTTVTSIHNEVRATSKELDALRATATTNPPENYVGNGIGAPGKASGQNNLGSSPILVGELGPEIHVDSSTGKWELLGQNGAEFVKSSRIKSNDIIFNANQTKKILNGKSYANGTNKVGNVDINARPIVENEDGSYSTTSTSWQEHQVGDEEHGHYLIGHFATIRTNGTRLTGPEVWDYAHYVLGSPDPFATDAAMDNLLYAVVDKLANGEYITDANFKQAELEAIAQDEDMHVLQDNMYRDERERLRSGQSHAIGKNNDLVGELGPEIIVHNGRQGIVGENGPVMGKGLVRPGDIVFNASQTRDLLTNGQTNTLGNSYVNGKSYAVGARGDAVEEPTKATKANTASNKANTSATDANTKALDDTKKEYTWIERKISLLDHTINMSTKTAENSRVSYDKRIEAFKEANTMLAAEVQQYTQALDTYNNELSKELNKIPQMFSGYFSYDQINMLYQQLLSGNTDLQWWKTTIKPTGQTDAEKQVYEERIKLLDTISDLVSNIDSTEEKIQETEDKIDDNVENIFNLRLAEQDAIISQIEAIGSDIETNMNIAVTTGRGIISSAYYEDLIDNSDSKIVALEDKLSILYDQLDTLDADSSEAYYNVLQQITSVEQEISSCVAQQAEWNEAIKELPITYIKSYIKNLNSIAENLTNHISILQAAGNDVTASIIKKQTELTSKIANQYSNELDLHQKKMKTYTAGSDKWNEEFEAIQEVENSLANIVTQMKEYEKQVLALPVTKLSKMKEYLGEVASALNQIQDDNLTKINAAVEIITRWAEEMIKPLQKQLDILEKQNEARKIQLDIEQAEYDLEKAKEERTIQTVNSKGELVYTADEDAIRDAQQAYEEAKYNKLVHDIQAKIDNIQEIADERTEKYEQIQKDVEYNQLVADAAKLAGTTSSKLIDMINSGKDSSYYNTTKKDYETTAEQIKQNDKVSQDLEAVISILERLNESRVAGEITESQYNSIANSLMTKAQNGTLTSNDTLNALLSANGYKNVNAVNSAVTKAISDANKELTNSSSETNKTLKEIKAVYDKYYKSWDELLKKIATLLDQADTAYKNQKTASSSYSYSSGSSSSSGGGGGGGGGSRVAGRGVDSVNSNYSGGYVSAPSSSSSSGPSVPSSERERLDVGRSKGLLKGAVKDSKYNQELIQKLGIEPVDGDRVLTLLKPNELVANTEQQAQLISNMRSGLQSALGLASGASVSHQPPQVNISMGDINLPNVKDADGFAKAMKDTFELNMNQYFSKVF